MHTNHIYTTLNVHHHPLFSCYKISKQPIDRTYLQLISNQTNRPSSLLLQSHHPPVVAPLVCCAPGLQRPVHIPPPSSFHLLYQIRPSQVQSDLAPVFIPLEHPTQLQKTICYAPIPGLLSLALPGRLLVLPVLLPPTAAAAAAAAPANAR